MKQKLEFTSNGNTLAGLLERPQDEPKAYALFAHCFTCGKDIIAASRVSAKLVALGYAVFRFDFTGLGNSDGDFSNTNFSSNLDDLLAATRFLSEQYQAPSLLVGHSLGGAACLSIAGRIDSIKAVVTIGSPATASRVKNNFVSQIDDIHQQGASLVKLGAREFTIKKQFLDDLSDYSDKHFDIKGKALLVMHSPVDETVPIEEAEKIYQWAKHPKSFISLDKANHLLSNKQDAEYVATAIAGWVTRYLPDANQASTGNEVQLPNNLAPMPRISENKFVQVTEAGDRFTQIVSGFHHQWLADEPEDMNAANLGPSPYDHVLAGLGACTTMTMRMYANLKKLPLDNASVVVKHLKHDDGSQEFVREISLVGELSDEQKEKLLSIANKCPVHRTLTGELKVSTVLSQA